ncbi:DUF2750 domain-containing protein [Flavobacterium psychrotrophum]|uniref:DUF2750 domain-containing protein n=1 Tax=Flavobacterium psychrotrophum TaxID=2294119 RepID=UPI000E313446|nr:DUF2750 domain-containing protein [Flavobacterium psychrotrophum]
MLKDTADVQLKQEKFIKTICETGIVYGLENEEGFATSYSNEYENEDGEPVEVICFWSEKAYANDCIKEDWSTFNIAEIPLADFIENWCIGMHNDELLAGTDFDSNMFGTETEPLAIIIQIIEELKSTGKTITLESYENIEELESQVNDSLED